MRATITAQAADAAIDRAVEGLQACCGQTDAAHRQMVANWIIAAEGIRLWNHVAHHVAAGCKDADLAMQLERWLRRYQAMWREVSRESELWRVRDAAVWYADELR